MKILLPFLSLFFFSSCIGFGTDDMPLSSEKELKENYIAKSKELFELKAYYNSITPNDLEVYIEFRNSKTIDFRVFYITTPKYPRKTFFEQWDFNPFDFKKSSSAIDNTDMAAETKSLDFVKKRLGWTDDTFRTIKETLDKANCISISNGDPANIGFRRSVMGKYYYNLFDKSLTDSLKTVLDESCQYKMYNDTVVFEYGGGAIGSQCFPDK